MFEHLDNKNLFEVKFYETQNGNRPVERFLMALPGNGKEDDLISIEKSINLLRKHGPELKTIYPKVVKYMRDGVYELRPKRNRILYFHFEGGEYILLHAFEKKTNQTPPNELQIALSRKKDHEKHNR